MKTAAKWLIACIVMAWASVSFFILCGEESPEHQMTDTQFIVLKLLGMASMYAVYRVARYINGKGWFPDSVSEGADL